jgi:hypothetical protein
MRPVGPKREISRRHDMANVQIGVKDRMTGEIVYKSRKTDYKTAHDRAEKWCKRHLGERGTIVEL